MSEVRLSRLQESDAISLFSLVNANRSRLSKFWWEKTTLSQEDSAQYIKYAENDELVDQPISVTRGIFLHEDLIGVGAIHTINWQVGRIAALGYWIGERYDGQGHGTGTVRALTKIAFDELMLEGLTINPRVSNVASRRIAEKNGFELVGIDNETSWQLNIDEVAPEVAHYRLARENYEQLYT